MSYAKMTPSDIGKMFTIPLDQMPKMSSPTTGKPTYTTMMTFQKAINKQALSIISATYPDLGWIGLVIPQQEFNRINANSDFVDPVNPGMPPTHATGATAAQISETVRQHELTQNEFTTFTHTRIQLRNMIITNVEDKYICALANDITSYNQVSPLQLLTHLWTTYGQITEADLSTNESRMYADWNPPTPIETLYEQLTEGKRFAARGNELIDDSQLARKGYNIVKKTGLFESDCKEWRNKPDAERTWINFQTFFANADDDRRKNAPTTSTAGYSANQIDDLVNHRLNAILQTWTQADDVPPDTPPLAPPVTPDATNDAINATRTLNDLFSEIKKLQKQVNEQRPARTKPKAQGTASNGVPINYCWTHGITRNVWHNSTTCSRPKDGHKKEATLSNKMGGSEHCHKPRSST